MGDREDETRRRFSSLGLFLVGAFVAVAGCSSDTVDDGVLNYCDIEPIFADKCTRCHSEPLESDIPIPLETYDQVYEYRSHVEKAVAAEFMPPTGASVEPEVEDLTDEEEEMILDWIAEGAPDCE